MQDIFNLHQYTRLLNPAQLAMNEEAILDRTISQFANHLIQAASDANASDIHLEAYSEQCRIRFRCDGLLYDALYLPPSILPRLTTCFKIMANLDIGEKRLPQDGRIQTNIDIRISTCPSLYGEKIVLRLLPCKHLDLNALGMTALQLKHFQSALSQPQGLVLITGPTGSGKSATLYAALQYLNQPDKNILSVEDPIEIALHGITQVNINPRIGLTFDKILRSFLRQDPDIIMIGEIRDKETAAMAIAAAQTGHLVLSTLHTNYAHQAIQRLQSLHISQDQIANCVNLVIAQRLIRIFCQQCKPLQPCGKCHTGYNGRTGIFEFSNSATTLLNDGLAKVQAGITSPQELQRVLGQS